MASNKRERELARARLQRQAERRAAARAARRRRQVLVSSVLAGVLAIGGLLYLGTQLADSGNTDTVEAAATPTASATAPSDAAPGDCTYTRGSKGAKDVGLPPTAGVDKKAPYTGTITLNTGTVEVAFDTAKAPCTVNSFNFLAGKGYFDKTPCHRLTTQGIFVLQCGDPTGTGSSGPGYSFPDENIGQPSFPRGTFAMANSGPDTNGSQFFLVYKDTTLPPNYAIVGHITKGLDAVDKAAAFGDNGANGPGDGKPNKPVTIESFTMKAAG